MRSQHTMRGTATLIRLALRRDRVRTPLWMLGIIAFTVSLLPSLPELYPDAQARQARAILMENPATLAMTGPGFGLDDYTFGPMVAQEFLAYGAILVAIMSLMLVVRHTRTEEETGRAELARAAAIGRHAALTAALSYVIVLNLIIAGLTAVLMPLALDELDFAPSALYSFALAAVGVTFAAIGAVAAQVTFSSRGAIGLGMAVLGFAYAARAVGDAAIDWLSWASPIGWAQQASSFVDDRWWTLLIPAGATIVLVGLAVALSRRRDVGAGLVSPRRGAAEASAALSGPFGLAWRLQRGTLIAWACGLMLLGVMYGSVAPEIESFVEDNSAMAEAVSQPGVDPVDSFMGVVVLLMALLVSAYMVQAALRMRTEETVTRAEPVLTGVVGRGRYIASHLVTAMLIGPLLLLASIGGVMATGAVAAEGWTPSADMVGAAAAFIPALWLVVAVGVALFGILPKAVHLVWLVLGYGVIVGMLGIFLDIPDWAMDISPFEHVPQWPAEDITATPLLVMTAIAAVLLISGVLGFRRRDLA